MDQISGLNSTPKGEKLKLRSVISNSIIWGNIHHIHIFKFKLKDNK